VCACLRHNNAGSLAWYPVRAYRIDKTWACLQAIWLTVQTALVVRGRSDQAHPACPEIVGRHCPGQPSYGLQTSVGGAWLVVIPPFQVQVAAWGLEACSAGDPLEQVRDVDVVKRLGFAIAPDEGNGSDW
jgi:hypothetical protein